MGRDLQKKKNRSGIAKTTQKPKSKRNPILANALIASNWDKKQTLSQNYRRLGLATRLNGASGGVEKSAGIGGVKDAAGKVATGIGSLDVKTGKRPVQFETGSEVRIERDPTTGAILRVVQEEGDDAEAAVEAAKHQPLDESLLDTLDSEHGTVDQHHNSGHVGRSVGPQTDFLQKLETDAARPGGKKIRKQSQREQEWCQDMYAKHGTDWSAMFKDEKLNVMQQSEGELKRRIQKWLKGPGSKDMNVETVDV